jgi:hypothetical protein
VQFFDFVNKTSAGFQFLQFRKPKEPLVACFPKKFKDTGAEFS